jgi:hypothetical protein
VLVDVTVVVDDVVGDVVCVDVMVVVGDDVPDVVCDDVIDVVGVVESHLRNPSGQSVVPLLNGKHRPSSFLHVPAVPVWQSSHKAKSSSIKHRRYPAGHVFVVSFSKEAQ